MTATYNYDNDGNVTSLAASSTVTSGTAISDTWTYNSDEQVAQSSINGATSEFCDLQREQANHCRHQPRHFNGQTTTTPLPSTEISPRTRRRPVRPRTSPSSVQATSCAMPQRAQRRAVRPRPTVRNTPSPQMANARVRRLTSVRWPAPPPTTTGTPTANSVVPVLRLARLRRRAARCPPAAPRISTTGAVCARPRRRRPPRRIPPGTQWGVAVFRSTSTMPRPRDRVRRARNDVYGDLLFGGTAPIEQITTSSSGTSVSYLVSNQTGVQGVYNGSGSSLGAVQEMAIYSLYGIQTIRLRLQV